MARREIHFAGRALVLDGAGALVLPDERVLVVADLHLEKGSAFAARRQFVPPYDTVATLAVLTRLVTRWRPRLVIALGDSFHDGGAENRMAGGDLAGLAALSAGRDWLWIAGNHDPEPPRVLAGIVAAEADIAGLHFRHAPDRRRPLPQVAGHLHPAAKVKLRVGTTRRRCFATDGQVLVLPALGAYTGGLNVRSPAYDAVFPDGGVTAFCLGGKVHAIAGALLLGD